MKKYLRWQKKDLINTIYFNYDVNFYILLLYKNGR